MADKVRENRLRRMAERQGMTLQKSKRRDPHAIDFGGYMLVDAELNTAVAGASPRPYMLSLDEVENILTNGPVNEEYVRSRLASLNPLHPKHSDKETLHELKRVSGSANPQISPELLAELRRVLTAHTPSSSE